MLLISVEQGKAGGILNFHSHKREKIMAIMAFNETLKK